MLAGIVASMAACSGKDIETEAGWRGVPLGASTAEVPDLVLLAEYPTGDAVYSRSTEGPKWGKARIAVRYNFWRDKLWKIEVRTGDSAALLDAIRADYGTPPFSQPWTWDGRKVHMRFKGHEYDSAALVTIISKAAQAERDAVVSPASKPTE